MPNNTQGGPKELQIRVSTEKSQAEWMQVLTGGASGAVIVKPYQERENRGSGSAAMLLFEAETEQ